MDLTKESVASRYAKRVVPSRLQFDPDELAPIGAQSIKVQTVEVQQPPSRILREVGYVGKGLLKVGKIIAPKVKGIASAIMTGPGPVIDPMTGRMYRRGPTKSSGKKKPTTKKKPSKKKSSKKK